MDWAIELQGVDVGVPGVDILHAIDWRVARGAHVALLGPNGCGKSTLLRAITAYGHITRGTACVLGETIGQTFVHDLRKRLGIVDASLARLVDEDTTAQQLVATGLFGHLTPFFDIPSAAQLAQARAMLQSVGLAGHETQLVTTLSAGQLRRTWLARALVSEPELLILDEPTADLDLLSRETLLATLYQLGKQRPALTIVTVTHHLEDLLPDTSHVVLLTSGRIVAQGSPEHVLTSAHVSATFGCPVRVAKVDGRWTWSVAAQAWNEIVTHAANVDLRKGES